MYELMFIHCFIEVSVGTQADLNTQELRWIFQYLSVAVKNERVW